MTKKSILIQEFHHKELVKISKVFGTNYGDLIQSMILYFKKTGINPTEAINENPALMVKALDKRIISFIKTQERDILKPMRKEIFDYSENLKNQNIELKKIIIDNSKWVKDVLIKINGFDKKRTERLTKELDEIKSKLSKQEKSILLMAQLIDTKNNSGIQGTLKNLFK